MTTTADISLEPADALFGRVEEIMSRLDDSCTGFPCPNIRSLVIRVAQLEAELNKHTTGEVDK